MGHQALLRQMNDYAQKNHCKSVVVTFNPHPQEVLQAKPDFFLINTFEQKIVLFDKLDIDTVFVIPFTKELSQTTAGDFFDEYIFSKINVRAIFMGPNHHFGKQREGTAVTLFRICEEKEIEILMAQEFNVNGNTVRSTLIRNYLKQNDFENAEQMMGHSVYLAKKK